jgi:hypothetical protein
MDPSIFNLRLPEYPRRNWSRLPIDDRIGAWAYAPIFSIRMTSGMV